MRLSACIIALLALFASPTQMRGAVLMYNVTLTGAQETPPTGSPATGNAMLTLNDVAQTLSIHLTYSGLVSPATNSHIHCCAPPTAAAPVVIPFIPAGFVTGTTSGTFNGSFTLTPTLVADIESGQSYVNVHSDTFPGGEIRGNITPATLIPEPGTIGLLAMALAGLLALRREER